jgi:hypothetical protein
MKWFNNLQVIAVSITSISTIEILNFIRNLQPDIMFAGQSIIGILTIVYLIKKIRKK